MNLLVTIDKNYIAPLITMLISYGEVHKGIFTDVYIAHSALEDRELDEVRNAVIFYDIQIHSIKITEKWFADTPVLERLPEESFYRLMAFHFLPDYVERCFYLDPDIYIRKSLYTLYQMDMEDHLIAAATHLHGVTNLMNKIRLGLTEQKSYINSGVMLMNIRDIRKEFTLENVIETLEDNVQKLLMGDQDLINILFGNRTIFIDECIYNLDERTFRYSHKKMDLKKVAEETAIIHYNGKYKPWLNGYKGKLDCFYPEVAKKGEAPTGKWKEQIKAIYNIINPSKLQKIFLAGIFFSILLWFLVYLFCGRQLMDIVSNPPLFREWMDRFGIFDEVIFVLIRTVQTMIKFIPAEPLEIGAGYAWGTESGMIYCLLGNMIGTVGILVTTKFFDLKIKEHFSIKRNQKILAFFQKSDRVYLLLFIMYLIPGMPKDGFTYLVGFLPVDAGRFCLITGIARIPSIISSTFCGANLAERQYKDSIIIFLATILLAVIFSRIAYMKL